MPVDGQQQERAQRSPAVAVELAARVALLALLWLAITGFDLSAVPYGIVAVAMATVAGWYLRPPTGRLFPPLATARFLGVLVVSIARASWDVARRAFQPLDRATAPGFVTHRLRSPGRANALGLSYAMTLTPGTVGATIEAGEITLHVLDHRGGIKGIEALEAAVDRVTRGNPLRQR